MLAAQLIENKLESDNPLGEIRNFRMHNTSSLGTLPDNARGQLRYLSSDDFLYLWRGTTMGWQQLALSTSPLALVPPSYTTAERDALTPGGGWIIFNSDSDKLNAFVQSSWRPVATSDYVDSQDSNTLATAQQYADLISQGFDAKGSVRAATTAALPANSLAAGSAGLALEGNVNGALPAQDGITLAVGESLLVKNETATENNGIYTVTVLGSGSTKWKITRRVDADESSNVTSGLFCWVSEGTTNADTAWFLSTNDPIVLGTTGLSFSKYAALSNIARSSIAAGTANHIVINDGSGFLSSEATLSTSRLGDNTVSYAKMQDIAATQRVIGRNTAGAGDPEEVTATQFLDWLGSTRGSILYKGASGWAILAPSAANNILTDAGSGADPGWSSSATLTAITATTATLTKIRSVPSTLTYAGTTNIDFDDDDVKTVSLTGAVTFTTSNKASGKSKKIRIICDSTLRAFTFPGWKFVGAAAPASIAASKTAMLTMDCFGANDTDIVAGYAVEP